MLAPRLALCAVMAFAGSAAAQQAPTMMAPMPNYQLDPNAFVDQPSARDPVRDCRDGKPHPGPAPKVVRTMPAAGSVVRPGAMVLSVTFDQPMACKANLSASPFPVPCPGGGGAVLISADRRTLTTVCVVEAGSSYSMPLVDFVGDGGARSERYDLAFTTSTAAPIMDARQAMSLERTGRVER